MARQFSEKAYRESTGASLDQWYLYLDQFGARNKHRDEIKTHLQSEKGITRFWATMIIGNYSERLGLGLSNKNRYGKYNLIVAYKSTSEPEHLFRLAMQSNSLPAWLSADGQTLSPDMILDLNDHGRLEVTDVDDIGWIRFERSLKRQVSVIQLSFKPGKGPNPCIVHIMESGIFDPDKVPVFRAFWTSIAGKILALESPQTLKSCRR